MRRKALILALKVALGHHAPMIMDFGNTMFYRGDSQDSRNFYDNDVTTGININMG